MVVEVGRDRAVAERFNEGAESWRGEKASEWGGIRGGGEGKE